MIVGGYGERLKFGPSEFSNVRSLLPDFLATRTPRLSRAGGVQLTATWEVCTSDGKGPRARPGNASSSPHGAWLWAPRSGRLTSFCTRLDVASCRSPVSLLVNLPIRSKGLEERKLIKPSQMGRAAKQLGCGKGGRQWSTLKSGRPQGH